MALLIFKAEPTWVHFSTTTTSRDQYQSAIARRDELEAALRVVQRPGRKRTTVQGQPVDESTLIELLKALDANWQQATLF